MTRKTQRLSRRHIKEDRTYENNGLATALSSYEGRRFIWMLLSWAGIFNNPFTSNALNTAHETGKMLIGQQLLARVLEVDADSYITMMQENEALQSKRKQETATEEDDDNS